MLVGALTLWVITFIIFALIRNMPGDPTKLMALGSGETSTDSAVSTQALDEMRKSYGLDKPWYLGYWVWLGNLVRADLGRSIYDQRLVTERIIERAGPTLLLSTLSVTLLYVISIPVGLYMTARNGRW